MADEEHEVEEGQEVVRRTIVGGRPCTRYSRKIRVPIGIEKVLVRAASDTRFYEALIRDRMVAVKAAGFALLPSEASVLQSVPDAVLAAMIGRMDVRRHGTRPFMRGVAAAALASAAATATLGCDETASNRVRDTRMEESVPDEVRDIWVREVWADMGISPEAGVPHRGEDAPPDDLDIWEPRFWPDHGIGPDPILPSFDDSSPPETDEEVTSPEEETPDLPEDAPGPDRADGSDTDGAAFDEDTADPHPRIPSEEVRS